MKRLMKSFSKKAVSSPIELMITLGVVLVVSFALIFSTMSSLIAPYKPVIETSTYEKEASAVAERLINNPGLDENGNPYWEFNPDKLAYLGLASSKVVSDIYYYSDGTIEVVVDEFNTQPDLAITEVSASETNNLVEGDQITCSFTVTNEGTGLSQGFDYEVRIDNEIQKTGSVAQQIDIGKSVTISDIPATVPEDGLNPKFLIVIIYPHDENDPSYNNEKNIRLYLFGYGPNPPESNPHYSCGDNGCVFDPNGEYTSLEECERVCVGYPVLVVEGKSSQSCAVGASPGSGSGVDLAILTEPEKKEKSVSILDWLKNSILYILPGSNYNSYTVSSKQKDSIVSGQAASSVLSGQAASSVSTSSCHNSCGVSYWAEGRIENNNGEWELVGCTSGSIPRCTYPPGTTHTKEVSCTMRNINTGETLTSTAKVTFTIAYDSYCNCDNSQNTQSTSSSQSFQPVPSSSANPSYTSTYTYPIHYGNLPSVASSSPPNLKVEEGLRRVKVIEESVISISSFDKAGFDLTSGSLPKLVFLQTIEMRDSTGESRIYLGFSWQGTAPDGREYTRKLITLPDVIDYTVIDPLKMYVLSYRIPYERAKKALFGNNLFETVDFNVRVVSVDGKELMSYGKSYDNSKNVIVDYTRAVTVYKNKELGINEITPAILQVKIFS